LYPISQNDFVTLASYASEELSLPFTHNSINHFHSHTHIYLQ
jgi:hypothetical protein